MLDSPRAEPQALPEAAAGASARGSRLAQSIGRFARSKPLGAVGGVIVLLLILVAFGARFGIIPLDDPRAINSGLVYAPPSLEFPLGTDHATRDVMSRLFNGAWISLYVGLGSVLVGITAGFVLGVAIAYAGGVIDLLFQRLIDALMALPGLIIALAIVAVLGSSLNNVIIAVVIGMIAPVVRTVRSQVLGLKELDYVLAARAVGASPLRIVFRHLAPNCFATYLILATYYLGFAIIIEASLSFLGVGTPPDIPSWGGMLTKAAQENIKLGFWVAMFPGFAIFIVVLGFNLLGDALRDVFDPKLRGSWQEFA